eukprot:TRINITY_DN36682_c0_g1_i1.p1 TRINITY_DN36682_c0_g1~~TRINITY_DN36682_c0_g1_i1.p1  ORF type:complete len:446 (+),score=77.12 TRINITY_DN36682_c0_g1_i1:55-1338(+)
MTFLKKLFALMTMVVFTSADPKMDMDLTSDNIPGVGSHVASVFNGFVVTYVSGRDVNNNQYVYLQGYSESGERMGESVVICEVQKSTNIPEIAGGKLSNRFMVTFSFNNEIFRVSGLLFEYGIELLSAPCPAGTDIQLPVSYDLRIATDQYSSMFVIASSRYEGRETNGIFIRIYGEDESSEATAIHVSTHQYTAQSKPDVCILNDMTIIVVWQDIQSHGVYMMRYSLQGYPLSRAIRVSRFVEEASSPTVTSLSTGYVIGWKEKNSVWYPTPNGVKLSFVQSFLQVFSNDGEKIGDEILVSKNEVHNGNVLSVIGCEDDTMWAVYSKSGRVHAKHFDLSGSEVQQEVTIFGHVSISQQHLRIGLSNYGPTGLVITFGTGLSMPISTYWWNGEDNTPLYATNTESGDALSSFFNHNVTNEVAPLGEN